MIIQQIQFLMRDRDGKTIVGFNSVLHNSHDEMEAFTDDKKLEYLRNQGYDVIRIVQPGENIIPVHFGDD